MGIAVVEAKQGVYMDMEIASVKTCSCNKSTMTSKAIVTAMTAAMKKAIKRESKFESA